MTIPCDMYFTIETKAKRLVTMLLRIYKAEDEKVNEALEFIEKIDFDSDFGNETFSFSTNKAWTIKVLGNVTWCKVNASSGNEGTHQLYSKTR